MNTAGRPVARKTTPTAVTVEHYLAGIESAPRRKDCEALVTLMSRVTKQPAVMWGSAIVGFGVRHYPLAGGKQGEICAVGFSSRKGDISIYALTADPAADALLLNLGKHKRGKGCLYVSRLSDIDLKVLEKLVAQALKGQAVKIQAKPRASPKARAPAAGHRIFRMAFSRVYPLLVAKVERKGRSKAEVDQVIRWLTGYNAAGLARVLAQDTDYETFFAEAPRLNANAPLITGVICGHRIEEIDDPLMRKIRWLDKLVDELARGRPMNKILRKVSA